MGQNPSSLLARPDKRLPGGTAEQEDELPNDRPSKRRKVASDGTPSIPVRRSDDLTLSPSRFYASATKAPRASAVNLKKIQDPVEFRKALRVDINEISSMWEDGDELREILLEAGPSQIRCKCSVTLSHTLLEDPVDEEEEMRETDLVKKVQIGLIELSCIQDEVKRVVKLEPFVFTAEEISVNRNMNKRRFSKAPMDYTVYDISDQYYVKITLESVGEQTHWPSLEVSNLIPNQRGLESATLQSKYSVLYGPANGNEAVPIDIMIKKRTCHTAHKLHVTTRWSVPNRLPQSGIKLDKPTTVMKKPVKQIVKQENPVDVTLESIQEARPQSQQESEAPVEARSTRGRTVNTYNLKTLSAQAQGKSPRKRRADYGNEVVKRRKVAQPEITLVYYQTDAFDNRIKKQHTFTGLSCPFCHSPHRSIDMLRFHWQTEHDNLKFQLQSSGVGRASYIVEITKNRPSVSMDGRIFQLGRPSVPFDLEKCLNGDDSWIRAREGPEHNHWPGHATAERNHSLGPQSSRSSSSRLSRYSTPNTSGSSDDPVEDVSKILSNLQIPRPRKTLLVPRTKKPLFHTVTKQLLQAGEELPDSDDDMNEDWFLLKHRDLTNDFTDVTEGEKEYTHKWTPFAMRSELRLPDTIIGFVQMHKDWLAESTTRRKWFTVHMGTLVRRNIITEKFLHRLVVIIWEAEAKQKAKGKAPERDVDHDVVRERGINECICREHVSSVDRVVCVGRTCKHRLYHKTCLAAAGVSVPATGKWICENCSAAGTKTIFKY